MIKYRYYTSAIEEINYVDIQQVSDDKNLIFKCEFKKNKNNKIDLTFYTPYLLRDEYMRQIDNVINICQKMLYKIYDNDVIQKLFELGEYSINNIFKEIQATYTDSMLVIQRRRLGELENFYD